MTDKRLATALVALQDRNLLIPGNVLADITPMGGLIVESHKEGWVLGHKYWRSQRIPVVCFENLSGGSLKKHSEKARIAVFNRVSSNDRVGFWGLLIQDQPQVMELGETDIQTVEAQLSDVEIAAVQVKGQQANVPNLVYVEERLAVFGGF
ncbi:MAG: chemotaxis protein CheW [Pseudomonadales bacterium]